MKLKNQLIVVSDIEKSATFYKTVLGLHVIMDFGANKTLTGGLSLQTLDTWQSFIGEKEVTFGANNAEIYFEEDNFDVFIKHLETLDSGLLSCFLPWCGRLIESGTDKSGGRGDIARYTKKTTSVSERSKSHSV